MCEFKSDVSQLFEVAKAGPGAIEFFGGQQKFLTSQVSKNKKFK